jgi:ABC-type antimicrobial peptide transport system permease subunit
LWHTETSRPPAWPIGFGGAPVVVSVMIVGLLWALVIGLVGALPPAVRAARIPVTEALRTA